MLLPAGSRTQCLLVAGRRGAAAAREASAPVRRHPPHASRARRSVQQARRAGRGGPGGAGRGRGGKRGGRRGGAEAARPCSTAETRPAGCHGQLRAAGRAACTSTLAAPPHQSRRRRRSRWRRAVLAHGVVTRPQRCRWARGRRSRTAAARAERARCSRCRRSTGRRGDRCSRRAILQAVGEGETQDARQSDRSDLE